MLSRNRLLRVLIVEDSEEDANRIVHELLRSGFALDWRQVDSERDYEANLCGDLDVILCDNKLPTLSAPRAIELLQARGLPIPFILVSGAIGEEMAVATVRQGAADYVLKDQLTRLGSVIERSLEARRLKLERTQADVAFRGVVDALSAHIAIVDEQGSIVAVNLRWREFARVNGTALMPVCEGANYLSVCEAAGRSGSPEAGAAAAGIREVLAGKSREFMLEYPCHSAREKRWFIMRATPFSGETVHGAVIAHEDITMRVRAEHELAGNRRLQQLLAGFSSHFFALPAERFGPAIEQTQRLLVEALGIDRSTLWQSEDGGARLSLTNCWHTAECPPLPKSESLQAIFPWMSARLLRGETVCISQVGDFPPEAKQDAETFRTRSTKSMVLIPLTINGKVFGAISFASIREEHSWRDAEVAELKIIARLIGDVIGSRRAEACEEQLRSELAHAMRVASLGELATTLAHELNQPLAAILSNAQAARRFLAGDEVESGELPAILDDIVRDDKRAGSIIQNLRAMVDKHPSLRARCCLNEITREVLELMRGKILESKIELCVEFTPELPAVLVTRVEIEQVLVNLLMNALHAMEATPSGSRIIEVSTRAEGAFVSVTVRDRGHGIPPERLGVIFNPFFSTKPGGLGIGLSICRRIIQGHGGHIEACNHDQGGAIFSIRLPTGAD